MGEDLGGKTGTPGAVKGGSLCAKTGGKEGGGKSGKKTWKTGKKKKKKMVPREPLKNLKGHSNKA